MDSGEQLDALIDSIGQQRFRAKFHLRSRERSMAATHGVKTMRQHARDLIIKRVAPAEPTNDGKQTPYRGHPVFVAQHATATCCRTCLERWHKVPKGRALSDDELGYVVDVIARWIERELAVTTSAAGEVATS
ncbi:MAG: hypothetical protein QOE09_1240 [Ilumatobacteraceae bacterium]|jgi:hypothetical protein